MIDVGFLARADATIDLRDHFAAQQLEQQHACPRVKYQHGQTGPAIIAWERVADTEKDKRAL